MSSRSEPGFDNRIAEILADELGALLSFEWIQLDRVGVEQSLHAGACDILLGIGESVSGVVSTVPYLRAPFVFVTRADSGIEIESLDDPLMRDLTIGTYPTGLPSLALDNRGISSNVREFSPVAAASGLDREAAILDALVAGEIDVAIVYGPKAAHRATKLPGVLRYEAVTPELDVGANILPLYRTQTIGVRPHDEVLRDRLNVALAARWDDVVDVIASYGVPQSSVTRPPRVGPTQPGTVRVGVVAPSQTRAPHGLEDLGEAVRRGAILADNTISRAVTRDEVAFEVLFASAPTGAAAVRAAERLVRTEGVVAIVGGIGFDRSLHLSQTAADLGVAFFNVGSSADALRGDQCQPNTLHVAASVSMYVDALVDWYVSSARLRWYVVAAAGDGDLEAIVSRVQASLDRHGHGAEVIGSAAVQPRQFVFLDEIQAIRGAEADVVLTIVGADEFDQFMVQFEGARLDSIVAAVPDSRAQTREMLLRFRQSAPEASASPRPALWDTALVEDGAGDLNERYISRNGRPMEGTAWSAYTAVMAVHAAARFDSAADSEALIAFLTDAATELDVGKGPGVSFRSWDRQLRQPLYFVRVDPLAAWGSRVSAQVALADVVGRWPIVEAADIDNAREQLDRLGDDSVRSTCHF